MSALAATYDTQSHTLALSRPIPFASRHRFTGLLVVALRLALAPDLLRELKGAPLSVLLALALRIDKSSRCFPSIQTISHDTGYGKSGVCDALRLLEARGFVQRTRRQRKSTLYTLPATPDPGQPQPARPTTAAPPPPTPDATPESKPAPTPDPSPSPQPATDKAQSEGEKTRRRFLQLNFDDDWPYAIEKLEATGISRAVAEELVERVKQRGRSVHFVLAWRAAYDDGHTSGRISGPGWLVAALRGDWDLPKAFRDMAVSEKERRQLFIKDARKWGVNIAG